MEYGLKCFMIGLIKPDRFWSTPNANKWLFNTDIYIILSNCAIKYLGLSLMGCIGVYIKVDSYCQHKDIGKCYHQWISWNHTCALGLMSDTCY